MAALLTETEFRRLSTELIEWIDDRGRNAPSEQWDCIMDTIRLYRPAYREGYCHGRHPPMRDVLV